MDITHALTAHRDNPEELEKLYRESPTEFIEALKKVHDRYSEHPLLRAWIARLAPVKKSRSHHDVAFLVTAGLAVVGQFLIQLVFAVGYNEFTQWIIDFSIPTLWLALFGGYFVYLMPRSTIRVILATILVSSTAYLVALPLIFVAEPLYAYGTFTIMLATVMFAFHGGHYPLTEKFGRTIRHFGELTIFMSIAMAVVMTLFILTMTLLSTIDAMLPEDRYITLLFVILPFLAWFIMQQLSPNLRFAPLLTRLLVVPLCIMLVVYLVSSLFSIDILLHSRDQLAVFPVILVIALGMRSILHFDDKPQTVFMMRALELFMATVSIFGIIGSSVAVYRIVWLGLTPNRLALALTVVLLTAHLATYTVHAIKSRLLNIPTPAQLSFFSYYAVLGLVIALLFPLFF